MSTVAHDSYTIEVAKVKTAFKGYVERHGEEPGTDFVRLKVKDTHVELLFPAVDANVSVTQSEFRQYLRMLLCPHRSGILVAASNGQVQFTRMWQRRSSSTCAAICSTSASLFPQATSSAVESSLGHVGRTFKDVLEVLVFCVSSSGLVVGGLDRGCKAAHCCVWIRGAT